MLRPVKWALSCPVAGPYTVVRELSEHAAVLPQSQGTIVPSMTTGRRRSSSLAAAAILLAGCATAALPSGPATPSTDSAVASSSLAVLASSPAASCLGPDPTLEQVIDVPNGERAACFGTADITLRGWVFEELNPGYDCVTPNEPMWLRCITSRQRLVAVEQAPAAWYPRLRVLWVATNPNGQVGEIRFNAREGPIPVNVWVEVSGHFSDPAAEACGPPGDPSRVNCESTLVVTRVATIAAP